MEQKIFVPLCSPSAQCAGEDVASYARDLVGQWQNLWDREMNIISIPPPLPPSLHTYCVSRTQIDCSYTNAKEKQQTLENCISQLSTDYGVQIHNDLLVLHLAHTWVVETAEIDPVQCVLIEGGEREESEWSCVCVVRDKAQYIALARHAVPQR